MTLNDFLSATFEQTPVTKFWGGIVAEIATQVFKEGCTAPPDTLVQFTHHCGKQTQRLNQLNVFVKLKPEHLYYRPWFSNWVTHDSQALCTHKTENGKRVFTRQIRRQVTTMWLNKATHTMRCISRLTMKRRRFHSAWAI